jgi:quinol-cytochrome oxidoreductase complex cytochrome b subunit
MDERPWVVTTRIALLIVAAIFGVLLVTGVMLVFGYRPDVTAAFPTVQRIPSHSQTRTVHRVASTALFPAFGFLAIVATGLALVRHRARRILPVAAAGVAALAASVTGFLLPWDQLALKRVTVGTNISGYRMILSGHDIRYVLLDNNMVGTSTVARWFWLHVVGFTLVLVVSLVIVAYQARATRETAPDPSSNAP